MKLHSTGSWVLPRLREASGWVFSLQFKLLSRRPYGWYWGCHTFWFFWTYGGVWGGGYLSRRQVLRMHPWFNAAVAQLLTQSWQVLTKCINVTIGDSSPTYSPKIIFWFPLPTVLAQYHCLRWVLKRKNEIWGCGNQHYCNTRRQIHNHPLAVCKDDKIFMFSERFLYWTACSAHLFPPILHCPLVWRQYGGNYNEVELLEQALSTIGKCSFEEFVYAKDTIGYWHLNPHLNQRWVERGVFDGMIGRRPWV